MDTGNYCSNFFSLLCPPLCFIDVERCRPTRCLCCVLSHCRSLVVYSSDRTKCSCKSRSLKFTFRISRFIRICHSSHVCPFGLFLYLLHISLHTVLIGALGVSFA